MKKKSNSSVVDEFSKYAVEMPETHFLFIQQRILSNIKWYDKKAIKYKKWYLALTLSSIAINAIIPILTTMASDFSCISICIALLSALAGICTSVLAINKFHELWIKYRYNCEMMKHHLHSYYASVCEYKEKKAQEDAFQHLCTNCEALLIADIDSWQSAHINSQSSTGV